MPPCISSAAAPCTLVAGWRLLHVIEPAEFQHWMSVEEVMREERRQDAERLLQKVAKQVNDETGTMPELHVREGTRQRGAVGTCSKSSRRSRSWCWAPAHPARDPAR